MEMGLNTGAFEALNQQEMLESEGGLIASSIFVTYLTFKAIYRGCKYLYDLGYENGYNSTRG